MKITKAETAQYGDVRAFYHTLTDAMSELPYGAGWIKDVYPAPEYLRDSIGAGELYVGTEGDMIVSAMILNGRCNESYRAFTWPTEAGDGEVAVIHALGVHPSRFRRGYAAEMVKYAVELARRNGRKVIRLDVLKGNLPAERLYSGLGFRYLHTLPMYYEDTGWTDYELYEYRL